MFLSVVLVLLSVYVSGRNAAGNQQSSMTSNGVPVDACGTHGPYSALAWLAPRGAVSSGQTAGVGMVMFSQEAAGQQTTIKGQISGLPANMNFGFHVHQVGNLTDGCESARKHYNPGNATHGGLSSQGRHAGDLGNIQSDGSGVAKINLCSDKLQLVGPWSVIGRTLVLHMKTDDLGLGGNAESLASGNADGRMSCGIIGQTTAV